MLAARASEMAGCLFFGNLLHPGAMLILLMPFFLLARGFLAPGARAADEGFFRSRILFCPVARVFLSHGARVFLSPDSMVVLTSLDLHRPLVLVVLASGTAQLFCEEVDG